MYDKQEKNSRLREVVKNFDIKDEIKEIELLSGGLINSTYKVLTAGKDDYILQKKNSDIFKDVPAMMDNIVRVTNHLRAKVEKEGGDPESTTMTVVFTKEGLTYYMSPEGDYWTMSLFIPDTIQFEGAVTPETAFKGGEGIGKFHKQMSDFSSLLAETLPGFHDLGYRMRQWDNTVANDKAKRASEVRAEIDWVEKRRPQMSEFWKLIEDGSLPKRVVHNDTKITNLLFNRDKEMQCVIDLDTVMSNTPLADFGDAIRTFANTGKEDDTNLDNVSLDLEIFSSYSKGYLSQMKDILTPAEKENLAFGALYITYEQVMRFLMDYLDGDTYYRIEYPDHNLVRTRAQMKLYESMEQNFDKMRTIVKEQI